MLSTMLTDYHSRGSVRADQRRTAPRGNVPAPDLTRFFEMEHTRSAAVALRTHSAKGRPGREPAAGPSRVREWAR